MAAPIARFTGSAGGGVIRARMVKIYISDSLQYRRRLSSVAVLVPLWLELLPGPGVVLDLTVTGCGSGSAGGIAHKNRIGGSFCLRSCFRSVFGFVPPSLFYFPLLPLARIATITAATKIQYKALPIVSASSLNISHFRGLRSEVRRGGRSVRIPL